MTSKRLWYHHDGSVLTLLSSVHVGNEVIISSNRTCRLLFSETTRPNARARVRPERPHRVQGRQNDLGRSDWSSSIFDRYIDTFPARGTDYAHYIDLSPLRSLTFLRPWSTESWPRLLLFTTKSRSHYVQLNGLNVRLSRPLLPPLFYYWRELCTSVVVKVVLLKFIYS